jgi:hypothetical protein
MRIQGITAHPPGFRKKKPAGRKLVNPEKKIPARIENQATLYPSEESNSDSLNQGVMIKKKKTRLK